MIVPATQLPRLRAHVRPAALAGDRGRVVLEDRLGLCDVLPALTPDEARWLELLDGQRTLAEVHRVATACGVMLPFDRLARWVQQLDDLLLLDTPRFRQVMAAPVRPARHAGSCYSSNADQLRQQLRGYFTAPGGPGLPRSIRADGTLRMALLPHIDYRVGGVSYAWGFKEIVERSDASLFVIIATSHYSERRFTLTRKHFQTPLGVVPTDVEFVDRVASHYGDGLFDDEWLAHLPEHSVELEAVFLRYLYEHRPDIRIVPLVVGSFHDCVLTGQMPAYFDEIGRMIEALRRTVAETRERICFLISGDLAHIGPKFNAEESLTATLLERSSERDHELIRRAQLGDAAGYFQEIARERDRRNICGFPPTYLSFEVVRPRSGKFLHYGRHTDPQGYASVSWASMIFEG